MDRLKNFNTRLDRVLKPVCVIASLYMLIKGNGAAPLVGGLYLAYVFIRAAKAWIDAKIELLAAARKS